MMIGEVEMTCFAEDDMKLISQYYYPNSQSNLKRFWLFSQLKGSRELPSEQQHWYPNAPRTIYVSNTYPNGTTVHTNQGDVYSPDEQTGTQNCPYPSLETAIYAAMATPDNLVEIIMMDTGTDYEIDDLVLRMPSMNMIVTCMGKVTFAHLHLSAGNLTVNGNASFERIATTSRSRLQITGGTFTATGRITETVAPYSIAGTVGIVNGKYTGGSDDIIFDFAAGTNGVVGFVTDEANCTTPRSNNFQQVDLTLYNVRNAGRRDRWTVVYSGHTAIQIGQAIATELSDFHVNDSTVFRVKWRAKSGDNYYNTVVHVNGNTTVDLSAMTKTSVFSTYRVVKMSFRPHTYDDENETWINGNIVISSVTDYSISGGAIVSAATNSGNLPDGVEIAEIAVRGY